MSPVQQIGERYPRKCRGSNWPGRRGGGAWRGKRLTGTGQLLIFHNVCPLNFNSVGLASWNNTGILNFE